METTTSQPGPGVRWRIRAAPAFMLRLVLGGLFSLLFDAKAANTATLIGNCQSVILNSTQVTTVGGIPGTDFFSTFDGRTDIPPFRQAVGGSFLYGGELRKRSAGVYEADYSTINNSSGGYIYYGSLVLNLSSLDSGGIGIPDFAQRDRLGSLSVTGTYTRDFPTAATVAITGSVTRNAFSTAGTYFVVDQATGGNVASIGGTMEVQTYTGNFTYTRGAQNTVAVTMSRITAGTTFNLTGNTPFTVTSVNQISLPQFQMTNSVDGALYTVLATTFARTGNKYIGSLQFADGDMRTSWADHTDWVFVITDFNDTDANSIPDLSDSLPSAPTITTQPQNQTVTVGANVTFAVVATGTAPLAYQWQHAGTNLPGETATTLVLNSVTAVWSGTYTVGVGNLGGTTTSTTATLTVNSPAPVIASSAAATATVGSAFSYTITANNSPTSYGATGLPAGLSVNSATGVIFGTPTTAGSFTVNLSASNAGGTGTRTLTLTVNGPPSITTQPQSATVGAGNSLTFSIAAAGTAPLSYQWRKDGTNITGASAASLTLSNVQTNQAGNYLVVITNAYGSVTSSVAALSVNRLAQTISFGSLAGKRVDDAPFGLSATATSGLPVSYASSTPGVAIVSGNTAAITGIGSAIITASQPGDATYLPAASVGQTLRVSGMPGAVAAWGANSAGEATVPAGLSGVIAVAAGEFHTMALKSNGVVVAWGDSTYGQTTVPAGLSGVMAIAAGSYHSLALKSNGTVVAWGADAFGDTIIPVGLSGVAAISAGQFHSVALKNDGTVLAWGANSSGQTTVPPGLSGVTAIAAGYSHTVALKNDGTVVAWGANTWGQTSIQLDESGVTTRTAIAAGADHTVALKIDGTVVAWGLTTAAPAGLSGVVAIATGQNHNVALKSDGTVVAWGNNTYGQTTLPVGLSGVTAVAAGGNHTVVIVPVPLPSITAQPLSQSVTAGANAMFTVTATGTAPLTYQWRKSGASVTGGTGPRLTLTNVQPGDAGSYDVLVTNGVGAAISSLATLTVNVPPTISTQPPSQTVAVGSSATFNAIVSGTTPFTYQWRKDGANFAGGTSSSFSIVNAQSSDAGSYVVVVSNVAGSVTSAPPAVLVVNGTPGITIQPQSQTVTVGANASFIAAASGTAPLSFQWRKSGSSITGATSATLSLNSVQLSDAGGYDVVVTNVAGSATSSVATLAVTTNVYTNLVLSVAGGGQYATIPSTPAIQPSNAITVELWFLPLPTAMANPVVLNKGDGQSVSSARSYEVDWKPSNGISFQMFLGSSTWAGITVPAPVNQWVHFAATYDSAASRINIFTNGILAASTTNDAGGSPLNGGKIRQTTLPLTFGLIPGLGNTYFNGSLDEVRIWNFARSGAEIFRDFHSRLAGTEPGLVGYWQFDGGTVADLTTNANNGSLTGGAQIVAITGADIPHIGAPTIPQLSQNLAVAPGSNVAFTVAATSIAPLSYQWMKDGVLLADQTNAQLNLSGLTNRARGGNFSVMVSNLYGAVTGNIGSLRVRVPHRLQPPVATNGMFRLLSADQDGGPLTTNDLPFFSVQTSTNLAATNWLSFTYTNGLSLTNGMLRLDDTNAASRPFRYYRVIEQ